jgi:Chaperonin 10 Kd subunit
LIRHENKEIPMKVRPLHDQVIVQRTKAADTTRSGLVIPATAQEKPFMKPVLPHVEKAVTKWRGLSSAEARAAFGLPTRPPGTPNTWRAVEVPGGLLFVPPSAAEPPVKPR